jgi:hypothetical protein
MHQAQVANTESDLKKATENSPEKSENLTISILNTLYSEYRHRENLNYHTDFRGVALTSHPQRSRMSRKYTPLPQAPSWRVVEQLYL